MEDEKMDEESKEEQKSEIDKVPESESQQSSFEEPIAERLVIVSAPAFDKTVQASEFLLVYLAKQVASGEAIGAE